MRWGRFSQFDFGDRDNVYLYVDRRGPLYWVLLLGLVFGALIWFMDSAMHPDWVPPTTRGKGAWPMALIYLMPLPVRVIAFACFLAILAECFYRFYHRMYDGRSAFVIGPSGVAQVDRWYPCSLGWGEVQEIRREMAPNVWGNLSTTIMFAFLSRPAKPPRHIPGWFWDMLPAKLTGRRVRINPKAYGSDEDQLIRLIRQFAGPVTIVDHQFGLLS
jgi:hypothetical protein